MKALYHNGSLDISNEMITLPTLPTQAFRKNESKNHKQGSHYAKCAHRVSTYLDTVPHMMTPTKTFNHPYAFSTSKREKSTENEIFK